MQGYRKQVQSGFEIFPSFVKRDNGELRFDVVWVGWMAPWSVSIGALCINLGSTWTLIHSKVATSNCPRLLGNPSPVRCLIPASVIYVSIYLFQFFSKPTAYHNNCNMSWGYFHTWRQIKIIEAILRSSINLKWTLNHICRHICAVIIQVAFFLYIYFNLKLLKFKSNINGPQNLNCFSSLNYCHSSLKVSPLQINSFL